MTAMTRVIRRKITDVNNRDFLTGKIVPAEPLDEKTLQHFENTRKKFEKKEVVDGKIFVAWFWRVTK